MAKYTLMKTEGRAKRAQFETVHGTIQTPVFINVYFAIFVPLSVFI